MRDEHILVSSDGPECNVIKIKPPMVFSKENVDEFISTLDRVLKELRDNNVNLVSVAQKSAEQVHCKEPRTRKTLKEQQIKSI